MPVEERELVLPFVETEEVATLVCYVHQGILDPAALTDQFGHCREEVDLRFNPRPVEQRDVNLCLLPMQPAQVFAHRRPPDVLGML